MVSVIVASAVSERKNQYPENSMAAQWLGLCTFTAKGRGSIPGLELRSHKLCAVAKKKKAVSTYFS